MCCNNKCENTTCEPRQNCDVNRGNNCHYLIIIVLYILLAIILGSYLF